MAVHSPPTHAAHVHTVCDGQLAADGTPMSCTRVLHLHTPRDTYILTYTLCTYVRTRGTYVHKCIHVHIYTHACVHQSFRKRNHVAHASFVHTLPCIYALCVFSSVTWGRHTTTRVGAVSHVLLAAPRAQLIQIACDPDNRIYMGRRSYNSHTPYVRAKHAHIYTYSCGLSSQRDIISPAC